MLLWTLGSPGEPQVRVLNKQHQTFLRKWILNAGWAGIALCPANVISLSNSSLMRTDSLRDLIKRVYIYPHAFFSARDIVRGSLEEPFEILQGHGSVCAAMERSVRVSCSVYWRVACTYTHAQPWKRFFTPRQQVESQRLSLLLENNPLLGPRRPFSDT